MEAKKTLVETNYLNLYASRLTQYAGLSSIFFGLISAMFLMKFKTGFLLGIGLGAGYCHNDLLNMMKHAKK